MIDMSELMTDPDFIQSESIPLLRSQGRFDDNGVWQNIGPKTIQPTTMVIQQSTPAQLTALPEGERQGDFITCWSRQELFVADSESARESDIVYWHNKQYRIVRCADRSDNGFYEAIAQFFALVVPDPPVQPPSKSDNVRTDDSQSTVS